METINCSLKGVIIKDGIETYVFEEDKTGGEYYLPKQQFSTEFSLDFGKRYYFFKRWSNRFNIHQLNLIKSNYKIGDILHFNVIDFVNTPKKSNSSTRQIKVMSEQGPIFIPALEWQKREIWNFPTIECEIIGFGQDFVPKLLVRDTRHPRYNVGDVYEFEVVEFKKRAKVLDSGNTHDYKTIVLKDSVNCIYEVSAILNQEKTLKSGDVIKCIVVAIDTRLRLKQYDVQDPFFTPFEEVCNDKDLKTKYFDYFLSNINDGDLSHFRNQYLEKKAFWVFTYCSEVLSKQFSKRSEILDYPELIEINKLLLLFENWILDSGIIRALPSTELQTVTTKKVEKIIHLHTSIGKVLPFAAEKRFNDFKKLEINIKDIFSFIFFSNIEVLNPLEIAELFRDINKSEITEEDTSFIARLAVLIDKRKSAFTKGISENYFIVSGNWIKDNKDYLVLYLNWSYLQYLLYDICSDTEKKNLTTSSLLIFYSHLEVSLKKKKDLLVYAYFIISNIRIHFNVLFILSEGYFRIDFDTLKSEYELFINKESWIELVDAVNSSNGIRLRVIEKYSDGFKVQYGENTFGLLPVHGIQDKSLKNYLHKDINWEISAKVALYAKDFNFFVAKQLSPRDENYLSRNSFSSQLPNIGTIMSGFVKSIVDFGIFVSTIYGDGLIYLDDITDATEVGDYKEIFAPGDNIFVKLLKIQQDGKISFGFRQLKGGAYDSFYYTYLYHKTDINSPAIESEDADLRIDNATFERGINLQKAYIFEHCAIIEENLSAKINYLRIAKQFFASSSHARSYLLNIYIEYFEGVLELNDVIENYSLERYDLFKQTIALIKNRIQPKTIESFQEGKVLIFFVDILSLFNDTTQSSYEQLSNYILSDQSKDDSKVFLTLAKITLANNLMISEYKTLESSEVSDFSKSNLIRIRDYVQSGTIALIGSSESSLDKEIREKVEYWRGKIELDEGEELEFKSTFVTPVPDEKRMKIIEHLTRQLMLKGSAEEIIRQKIDEIEGLTAQKKIMHSTLKSIAAFANTNGGVCILGVSDDKKIYGLEADYKTLSKGDLTRENRDEFGKFFDSKLKEYFGKSFSSILLRKEFLKFPDGDVLIIQVNKSAEEVFLLKNDIGEKGEELYVRNLSSSEKLEGIELAKFVREKMRARIS